MKYRYPLKIHKIEKKGKTFYKAAAAIEKLRVSSGNFFAELKCAEIDYEITLATAKKALSLSAANKRSDPRAYWFVGKALNDYLARLEEMGFYLLKQNRTFSRDLGISESSVKKILAFQRRYPNLTMIDSSIPWSRYRDNKV
jgi:hypothetical protein